MSVDDEFVRESRDRLRVLTNGLVTLEQGTDADLVDELFRTAHTLKGSCGMVGLDDASRLAHAIEDLLSALRQRPGKPSAAVIDAALTAVDGIDVLLTDYRAEGASATDVDGTVEALRERIAAEVADPDGDRSIQPPEPSVGDGDGTEAVGEEAESDDDAAGVNTDGEEQFDDAVLKALDAATEFDDLDELVAERTDHGSELSSWGFFDRDAGTASGIAGSDEESAEPDSEGVGEGEAVPSAVEPAAESPETDVVDAMNAFRSIKEELGPQTGRQRDDLEELQRDIDAVEFGEFDDDDDLTIDDLIEGVSPEHESPAVEEATSTVEEPADPSAVDPDGDRGVSDAASESDSPATAWSPDADGAPALEAADTDTAPALEAADTDTAPALEAADSDAAPALEAADDFREVTSDDTEVESAGDRGVKATDNAGVDAVDEANDSHRDSIDLVDDTSSEQPSESTDSATAEQVDSATAEQVDSATAEQVDSATAEQPDADEIEAELPDLDEIEIPDDGAPVIDDWTFDRDDATVEFESRFEARFADVEERAKAEATLVQRVPTTIEESALDDALFAAESPTDDRSNVGDHVPDMLADGAARIESLSVDIENADTLLDLVEELTRVQLQLQTQAGGNGLGDSLSALESVTAELRQAVTELRLMPLSTVVDGLPRVVRDVARQQGTRVSFDVDDDGVHLDRSIIDRLGDSLVHLVRNAVDHGIELPAERERLGKPAEGHVELRARRDGGWVEIEVTDDGRGIDAEAVRQRAIEAGIVTESASKELRVGELYELVFESGLSTASDVTDVSGRGVGMDVVERTVEALDGTVELDSEPDVGTTVRLRIPVSIAIAELLFVTVGTERFGIPVTSVEGVQRLHDGLVVEGGESGEVIGSGGETAGEGGETIRESGQAVGEGSEVIGKGDETVDVDGESIVEAGELVVERGGDAENPDRFTLLDLGESFSVPGGDDTDRRVVVRTTADRPLGILCDEVDEPRAVVVKPYEALLGNVAGVSGATVLGDGELVNVIDVTTL